MIVELVVPRDVYDVLGGQADWCEGLLFSPLQLVTKPSKQILRFQVVQLVLVHPFLELIRHIEETIAQKIVVAPACQSLSHHIQFYVLQGNNRELILLILWEVVEELERITHFVISVPILFVISFKTLFVIIALKLEFKADCLDKLTIFDLF